MTKCLLKILKGVPWGSGILWTKICKFMENHKSIPGFLFLNFPLKLCSFV